MVLFACRLINKATEHTQSCAQWFKRRVRMRAILARKSYKVCEVLERRAIVYTLMDHCTAVLDGTGNMLQLYGDERMLKCR